MRFDNKRLGVVAIFKNQEGDLEEVFYITGTAREKAELKQVEHLESNGYKLESLVSTNIKELFHKTKLKSGLAVLRNYVQRNNKYLQEHMGFTPDEVLAETQKLMHDYEEVLMEIVAMRCSRLINIYEVEVTDELALQCLDWRNRELGKSL